MLQGFYWDTMLMYAGFKMFTHRSIQFFSFCQCFAVLTVTIVMASIYFLCLKYALVFEHCLHQIFLQKSYCLIYHTNHGSVLISRYILRSNMSNWGNWDLWFSGIRCALWCIWYSGYTWSFLMHMDRSSLNVGWVTLVVFKLGLYPDQSRWTWSSSLEQQS